MRRKRLKRLFLILNSRLSNQLIYRLDLNLSSSSNICHLHSRRLSYLNLHWQEQIQPSWYMKMVVELFYVLVTWMKEKKRERCLILSYRLLIIVYPMTLGGICKEWIPREGGIHPKNGSKIGRTHHARVILFYPISSYSYMFSGQRFIHSIDGDFISSSSVVHRCKFTT